MNMKTALMAMMIRMKTSTQKVDINWKKRPQKIRKM